MFLLQATHCIKMTGVHDGKLGTKRFCSSTSWGNFCEYIKRPGDVQEYRSCVFSCSTFGCNGSSRVTARHHITTVVSALASMLLGSGSISVKNRISLSMMVMAMAALCSTSIGRWWMLLNNTYDRSIFTPHVLKTCFLLSWSHKLQEKNAWRAIFEHGLVIKCWEKRLCQGNCKVCENKPDVHMYFVKFLEYLGFPWDMIFSHNGDEITNVTAWKWYLLKNMRRNKVCSPLMAAVKCLYHKRP